MEKLDKTFFDKLLGKQSACYYAHLPKPEQTGRKPELLSEHSALTVAYAQSLANANGLNSIIERLINDSIPSKLFQRQLLAETMNKWFWRAIAFHDLGKINHLFQQNRMKNKADILKVTHDFESQHSIISAYLYLALFFSELLSLDLSDEEQIFLSNVVLYMSCPIKQHHSAYLDDCQNEETWCEYENSMSILSHKIEALRPYIHSLNVIVSDEVINNFHEYYLGNANLDFGSLFYRFNEIEEPSCGFPLYSLVKLLYSLLTASDYLATSHYMNNWSQMPNDFGVITNDLRQKIITNARTAKSYNKKTFDDLDAGIVISPDDYRERSGKNLNTLREALAMEIVKNTRQNYDNRLFYIEAPTGSGKTNASMLALSELLANNPSVQKVFYVFPFTTLITQTYKSMKDTLGLSEGEIVEFHSKSTKNTGKYEDDYLNYLDTLFLNVPIVLLSHVTFFDVLKTNGKDNNYLLQRMAHSVVVIDEIQSYSPTIWDKIVYFIANYAEYFDMRFIIMSATLPKIGELIDDKVIASKFIYLVNGKNKYFQNPNFCNRVTFDYSLLELEKPEKDDLDGYLHNLCTFISDKSEEYANINTDNPDSVLTVIEFIFKKTASRFCEIATNTNTCFEKILLLSGTILEPQRKQIINSLKSAEYRMKKVLLVTTQVVEAGVDIDMDLGFKDISLIDSEEQLAGRINRNANKKTCKLYLFDCNAEKTIYGGDDRYKFAKEINTNDYQNILTNKDFDSLYQKVIEHIKTKNQSKFIVNMQDLCRDVAHLDYQAVDKSFEIISQKNTSVFVPLPINANLIDESFVQIMEEFEIEHTDTVSGLEIWEKYKEIILSQDNDFILNRIRLNKIRALMSLFTFSVFPNSKEESTLKTYGKEEYGYLFLESYSDVYSLENGINTLKFQESCFL
jgi:CRISPR-associated endonuclease/helicase Cas3